MNRSGNLATRSGPASRSGTAAILADPTRARRAVLQTAVGSDTARYWFQSVSAVPSGFRQLRGTRGPFLFVLNAKNHDPTDIEGSSDIQTNFLGPRLTDFDTDRAGIFQLQNRAELENGFVKQFHDHRLANGGVFADSFDPMFARHPEMPGSRIGRRMQRKLAAIAVSGGENGRGIEHCSIRDSSFVRFSSRDRTRASIRARLWFPQAGSRRQELRALRGAQYLREV